MSGRLVERTKTGTERSASCAPCLRRLLEQHCIYFCTSACPLSPITRTTKNLTWLLALLPPSSRLPLLSPSCLSWEPASSSPLPSTVTPTGRLPQIHTAGWGGAGRCGPPGAWRQWRCARVGGGAHAHATAFCHHGAWGRWACPLHQRCPLSAVDAVENMTLKATRWNQQEEQRLYRLTTDSHAHASSAATLSEGECVCSQQLAGTGWL